MTKTDLESAVLQLCAVSGTGVGGASRRQLLLLAGDVLKERANDGGHGHGQLRLGGGGRGRSGCGRVYQMITSS